MRKAVVTGGAGFIGSHIADALIAQGFEVHVVDDLSAGKREHVPADATFHQIDIRDTAALTEIVSGAYAVFHLAANPKAVFSIEDPVGTHGVNVEGTLSVLMAARDGKARRLIFSSSSAVYGDQETVPVSEDAVPMPVQPYGLHKLIGEYYLRLFSSLYGLSTVSLRYFNVYGPRLDPHGSYALVVGRFITQRLAGEPLTVVGDGMQTRDFVHVDDIVRANLLAMESESVGVGEVLNIGTGSRISVNEIADLFGDAPRTTLPSRPEVRHSQADNSRARELLGWEPSVAPREGIAAIIASFGL